MLSLHRSVILGSVLAMTTLGDAWAGPPKGDKGDTGPTFDKQAATAVLSAVDLTKCRATNAPKGEGHVFITFAPKGTAQDVVLDKGPMMSTPAVAKCIVGKFKQAKIPAFVGTPVQVGKTFRFE
jgi:hypothetical protein